MISPIRADTAHVSAAVALALAVAFVALAVAFVALAVAFVALAGTPSEVVHVGLAAAGAGLGLVLMALATAVVRVVLTVLTAAGRSDASSGADVGVGAGVGCCRDSVTIVVARVAVGVGVGVGVRESAVDGCASRELRALAEAATGTDAATEAAAEQGIGAALTVELRLPTAFLVVFSFFPSAFIPLPPLVCRFELLPPLLLPLLCRTMHAVDVRGG